MRSLVVVCLALLVASAYAATFEFIGNVTLTAEQTEMFKYRSASLGSLDVGAALYRGWYKSSSISNNGGGFFSADIIWGEIFSGLGVVPAAYLSYFNGSAQITPGVEIDIAASASFIGGAFLGLVEVDPNGNVVDTVSFLGTLSFTWAASDTGDNNGLKWVTLKGKEFGKDYEVLITFIVTDKVGIINRANTVVNPRTIESIVEIKNWPYASTQNKLVLKTAVATAEGTLDGSLTKLSTGEGLSKVYASLQATAEIQGGNANVAIKANITSDFNTLGVAQAAVAAIRNAVEAKYGAKARVAIFDVEFPAGASDIVWDPTFGQGDILVPQTSSASNFAASLLVALLVALLALLF